MPTAADCMQRVKSSERINIVTSQIDQLLSNVHKCQSMDFDTSKFSQKTSVWKLQKYSQLVLCVTLVIRRTRLNRTIGIHYQHMLSVTNTAFLSLSIILSVSINDASPYFIIIDNIDEF